MTLDEIIESNMKVQELMGKIEANKNIIAFAKEQIDLFEKQVAKILNNSEVKE